MNLNGYDPVTLSSRPIEHIYECTNARELGDILGCGRDLAWRLMTAQRMILPAEEDRLRAHVAGLATDGYASGGMLATHKHQEAGEGNHG